jgi:hypothetical protein
MNEKQQNGLTVREMAASLDIRLGTAYGLLWDGSVSGSKDSNGEWIVDEASVEAYRRRRRPMASRTIDIIPGHAGVLTAGS